MSERTDGRTAMLAPLLLLVAMVTVSSATSPCTNTTHFIETYNSNLTHLTQALFDRCWGLRAIYINISHNAIQEVSNRTFEMHFRCQTLDLSYNRITWLGSKLLETMNHLAYLDLSHNDLTQILSPFMSLKPSIEQLYLSHNNISYIEPDAFNQPGSSLYKLREVDLSNNSLTAFEPWFHVNFVPSTRTMQRRVDLSWNQIRTCSNPGNWIFNDTFYSTEMYVDLRDNDFRIWDDGFVTQYVTGDHVNYPDLVLSQLGFDIRNNAWHCDCRIHNLVDRMYLSMYRYGIKDLLKMPCLEPLELRGKEIFFDVPLADFVCNVTSGCPVGCTCVDVPELRLLNVKCKGAGLTQLPVSVPDLKYGRLSLNLDDNDITKLETRYYLQYLTDLSMADNNLESISGDAIKMFGDVATIDFSGNRLQTIPRELQVFRYETVQLGGNPLLCNCEMLWMANWIKLAPKYEDRTLPCATSDGTGYQVMDLDEDSLECDKSPPLVLIIVLSGVLLLIIVLLVTAKRCPYETKVLLFKIFRIHPSDKYVVDAAADMQYDVYVSCDCEDPYLMQWVRRRLLVNLEERKPQYRLFVVERDLLPGGNEAEQRLDMMEKSRRVMVLVTKGYDDNEWCQYESYQAQTMEESDKRVFFVLYDDDAVTMAESEPWLSQMKERRVLSLDDRLFWDKLRYEMPVLKR